MFTYRRTFSILSIITLLFVSSCAEDGATGPIGPVGAEGQIGPTGADGKDASVTSITFNVAAGDWATNGNYLRDTIIAPQITQEIARTGAVIVYRTTDANLNTATWEPLPSRFLANIGGTTQFINVSNTHTTGELHLAAVAETGVAFTFNNAMVFRVVLISKTNKIRDFDYNDYEAVNMVYNIQDAGLMQQ